MVIDFSFAELDPSTVHATDNLKLYSRIVRGANHGSSLYALGNRYGIGRETRKAQFTSTIGDEAADRSITMSAPPPGPGFCGQPA
ncbi:hypothetical protein N7523_004908 [Penicillium sp. IBT 18751x]|nr:hypothetical protein N7523_004908 [Penicillium sp. IBT 18751x]